jgi:(2Fe-2S) ferredoxin
MPPYKYHLFVCTNRRPEGHPKGCCSEKGSEALREFFKNEIKRLGLHRQVRANIAGCLDTCQFGPSVVVYPEAVWYQVRNLQDAKEILECHIQHGEIVERLRMPRP